MTAGTSTLLLSDFHAGHHDAHRDRKLRALDAMARFARDRDVGEVVLAGDIVDERPDRARVREECDMLRNALGRYDSVFLRGNHDEAAFFDVAEMEELLRCRIDERPWHVSPVSGIVVTHGHHFRTPAIRRALREAAHSAHLDELFSAKKAVRHQKAMNKGFSMAGRLGNRLGDAGIPATELWEHLQQVSLRSRGKVAVALRRKRKPSALLTLREYLADAIDVRSVRHAARLARTLRSWGAVSGHTHVPGLYRHVLEDPFTGERVPFLIGNSGSFVSRYAPTFIEIRYPGMRLWQYDERADDIVEVQAMELSAADLETQARFFDVDNVQAALVDKVF
jgi:predicted phosphodiesterase